MTIVDNELLVEVDLRTLRNGPAKELLAIGVDAAGVRHAIYPTAERTLCSRADDDLELRRDLDAPDCATCRDVAGEFDRIDRSCPGTWFRHGEAVAA